MVSSQARNARPIVVGIGECLWDLLPGGKKPGGAPANFAYHASSLGCEGIVVTAVGADSLGSDLTNHLKGVGLSGEHIQVNPNQPTGTVEVEIDDGGQPRYQIVEGVAWDGLAWSPALEVLAARADCVCLGTLAQRSLASRDTIQRFVKATRADCLRIFDVNFRAAFYSREVIEFGLDWCQVVKLNHDEWPVLARMMSVSPDLHAGLQQLRKERSLSLVALTRGSQGSLLLNDQGVDELAAPVVGVVDTIGAGDAFTASLAAGILQGQSVADVHRWASAVAGFVCSQAGATPVLPAELLKLPRSENTRTAVAGDDQGRRTHRQRAYGVIRRDILLGRLESGTRINERELAEKLGMSRIPIREALLCLHGEGLLSKSGTRGLKVVAISGEEVRCQVEFRTIVECAAVRLACRRITAEQLERLREMIDEQEVLVHAKDWQAFRESDVAFHHQILKAANNLFLTQLSSTPALGSIFSPKQPIELATVSGHRKILEALREDREDDVEKLLYEHITGRPFESKDRRNES